MTILGGVITTVAVGTVTYVLVLSPGFGILAQDRKTAPPTSAELPSSTPKRDPFPPPPVFRDIAAQAGLRVAHISSPDKKYIVESMSGGVGLFDCDNDAKLDTVVVNGSTIDHFKNGGDLMVTLYRQTTAGKFIDTTKTAGLDRRGWGMGVAVADFDNDGRLDLYVTGYGGNALYRNLGDCKFEDVSSPGSGERFKFGASRLRSADEWA